MMVRSIAFVCIFAWLVGVDAQQPQLVAGHVLFRHGDRTPIVRFPTDPYQEADWPNGFGQLTKIGIEQQQRLGQYLRMRYGSLLNTIYAASEISIRSTDFDRTLMSAQSNLAGLYPALSLNASVPIQPIPIHTVPVSEDYLLSQNDCPRFDQVVEDVHQSDEVKKINAKYAPFFKKLEAWTNLTNMQLYNTWGVPDTIFIEHLYNRTPTWADEGVQQNLSIITDLANQYFYSNTDIQRIRGGPLIQEILMNMKDLSDGKSSKKVKIYSAHDTTISAALSFLGINYPHWPQYASALFIDLYKKDATTFTVRVEYLNVTDSNTSFPYQLDGCPSIDCPLTKFSAIYTPRLPASADIECAKKMPMPSGGNGNMTSVIVLFLAVLIAIIIIIFMCIYCRRLGRDPPLLSAEFTSLA